MPNSFMGSSVFRFTDAVSNILRSPRSIITGRPYGNFWESLFKALLRQNPRSELSLEMDDAIK